MLTFLDGGPWTTVQDLGRTGCYGVGIPPSGAMDEFAHSLANALVGNPVTAATLECTLMGPSIRFDTNLSVAITGADMAPTLNRSPVAMWKSFEVKNGDVLRMARAKTGCRSYVSVSGGVDVPLVLGSRSTYTPAFLGGHRGRRIVAGARLEAGTQGLAESGISLPPHLRPAYCTKLEVAIILGPQDFLFSDTGVVTFLGSYYRITSRTNRTASRLSGPIPEARNKVRSADEGSGPTDIIEDGNAIGTIQIAGGTEPIVMLRDAPSTGGYAKIATLMSAEVDAFGQVKPGDVVRFISLSLEESRNRLIEHRRVLSEALDSLN